MLVRSGVAIDDADREELRSLAAPPGPLAIGCAAVPIGVLGVGIVLVALGVWGVIIGSGAVVLLAVGAIVLGTALLIWAVVFTRAVRAGGVMALQPDVEAIVALKCGMIATCEIKAEAAWLVEQGIGDDDLRTTVVRVGPGRFVVLPQPPGFEELSEGTWRSKPTRTIDAHSEIRWLPGADGTLDWLRQTPLPTSAPLRLRPGLPRIDETLLNAVHAMGDRPREIGLEELPEAWHGVLAEP